MNTLWARALVDELVRSGVRDVCLAPGSRSTPLVLALASERRVRARVHLDERSAAFFALGVGRATGRPAAVLTTSGTAAANLFPAVIEASWGEVPLVVLTADRPHRLRGADANQAIDQTRLYGPYVREFVEVAPPSLDEDALLHLRALVCRAVARATGAPAGPVHLNVPFAKPLEPSAQEAREEAAFAADHPLAANGRADGRPFVEVGESRPEVPAGEIERLAALVAGSPEGLIVAGPCADPRAGEAALALGSATGFPVLADPLSGARFGPCGGEPHEGTVLAAVAAAVPAGGALFVSSSMPVRDLDGYAAPRAEPLHVLANRGASGIDGIVSSAFGAAAGLGAPVVCVLGDIAFFHDQNGLLWGREEDAAVVFVLIDNDGGGIFHMLPVRGHEPHFTPYFATPHGLDLAHAARMHAIPCDDVTVPDLGEALAGALAAGRTRILRVRMDVERNVRRHREVVESVTDRVQAALTAAGR